MGRRGPAKLPENVVELRGNPGKRKRTSKAGKAKPVAKTPTPPAWVCAEGKKYFKRIATELTKAGVLTNRDLEAFASMCHAYGSYIECEKKLSKLGKTYKTGTGYIRERPEVKNSKLYFTEYLSLLQQFGLTPSSRQGIPEKEPEDETGEEEIFGAASS